VSICGADECLWAAAAICEGPYQVGESLRHKEGASEREREESGPRSRRTDARWEPTHGGNRMAGAAHRVLCRDKQIYAKLI
jgi:hypothetical protein